MAVVAAIHVLAAAIVAGGLFFACIIMRPAAGSVDPGVRLPLWRRTFQKFFLWVGGAVLVLGASGYLLAQNSGAEASLELHIKHAFGWAILLLLVYIYVVPFRRMEHAMGQGERPRAAQHLRHAHRVMYLALALALASIAMGAEGSLLR
jgi:uncharacterized membrane protein